jgi:GNAT superfamily N-acetyltransferase
MWWRLTRSQFSHQTGQKNKQAFKRIIDSGEIPGILLYAGDEPIGWCSVAPRENYASLERSRTLKRVDDQPVWSVVCFFVAKPFRRQGIMVPLLNAAVEYARKHGAKIVEGYPIDSKKTNIPDASNFVGLASAFRKAGFSEVLRRSEHQPIMRYLVEDHEQRAPHDQQPAIRI